MPYHYKAALSADGESGERRTLPQTVRRARQILKNKLSIYIELWVHAAEAGMNSAKHLTRRLTQHAAIVLKVRYVAKVLHARPSPLSFEGSILYNR